MGDLQSELVAIYPVLPLCPPNFKFGSIAELYAEYLAKLEDTCVIDVCGQKNWFRAENFPHLVKLEFYNARIGGWVDAAAGPTLKSLKANSLNEAIHRIGDDSRPRTLFWIPEVIRTADHIHPNARGHYSDVYAKRYRRLNNGAEIKLALVETRRDGDRVIKTSFWSSDEYHQGCIAHPAKYPSAK
jgi:hypothetical protein